jgi:hypothetical protein
MVVNKKHNYITLQDVKVNNNLNNYIIELRKLTERLQLSELDILDLENNTPIHFLNSKLINSVLDRIDNNYSMLTDSYFSIEDKINSIKIEKDAVNFQIRLGNIIDENFSWNLINFTSNKYSDTNTIELFISNIPDLSKLENMVIDNRTKIEKHEDQISKLDNRIHDLFSLIHELQIKVVTSGSY